jgi:hypothetical protein
VIHCRLVASKEKKKNADNIPKDCYTDRIVQVPQNDLPTEKSPRQTGSERIPIPIAVKSHFVVHEPDAARDVAINNNKKKNKIARL